MARLLVESGIDKGLVFELGEGRTSLGRSANNAVQIIDKRMSRHHVEFLKRGSDFILCDLGSKNGTFLNNQRVTGESDLSDNDRIRIGETVLLFQLDELDRRPRSSEVELVDPGWIGTAAKHNTMSAGAEPMEAEEIGNRTADLQKEAAEKGEQIGILLAVADAIRTIFDLEELLKRLSDIICRSLDPDTAVIFLKDEKTQQLYPVVSRVSRRDDQGVSEGWDAPEGGIRVSRTIVDRATHERLSILMADREDQRFSASESVIVNRIHSAICSPLLHKEELLGAVYIDTTSKFTSYTTEQQELLTGIVNQAAMAISNVQLHNRLVAQQKLEKEMEIARTIQMNLLPKEYPEFENFELAAMSVPAKDVGGDYYDFVELEDDVWGVAIADVSGKGVPAALLTTTVRASMLAFCQGRVHSPPDLMKLLNGVTHRDSLNNMFVTMVYATIADKTRQVEFTNAGHAHPLIFDAAGGETPLIKGGCFLGIDEEMDYEFGRETMKPGSVLVLYTDGVTDTSNEEGQQFGSERFKRVVRENLEKSAQEIVDALYQASLSFKGTAPQFDDFTLIVCKCLQ